MNCQTSILCALTGLIVGCPPGVTPVSSGDKPIQFTDSPFELRASVELDLGADSSNGVHFSVVKGIAVDHEGVIYVADQFEHNVRAFDSAGRLLRHIGGYGRGPGELTFPTRLVLSNDTLFVVDSSVGSLNIFRTDGSFLNVVQVGPGINRAQNLVATHNGLVEVMWGTATKTHLVLDSIYVTTLDVHSGQFAPPVLQIAVPKMAPIRGSVAASPPLGSAPPSVDISQDGRIFSTKGYPFAISVMRADGKLIDRASAAVPRMRVSSVDEERDFQKLVQEAQFAHVPPPRRSAYRVKKEKYRSPIGALILDDAGNLWVKRQDLLGDDVVWDHLSTKPWRLDGRVHLPNQFTLRLVLGCHIYGVTKNDLAVESVTRYRITPCQGTTNEQRRKDAS